MAAFLMGLATLLLALELITPLNVGTRLLLILVIAGLAISAPYGVAWMRHREPPPPPKPGPIPAELRGGEAGATYVVVNTEQQRRRLRPRELSASWYALYNIFWRAPVSIGDHVLVGVWRVVNRVWGLNTGPSISEAARLHGDLDRETPPDRELF